MADPIAPASTPSPLDDLQAQMVAPPAGDSLAADGVDPATQPVGKLPQIAQAEPVQRNDEEPDEAIVAEVREWWRRTGDTEETRRLRRQMKRDTATVFGEPLGEQGMDEQLETEDRATVTTRHVYRNAVISMAMIMPNDPEVVIEPESQLPKYDLKTGLPADGDSDGIDPFHVAFADVLTRAEKKFSVECDAVGNLRGFFQDSHHYELGWLVTTWQQNYRTDSMNGERLPDIQDQVAELEVLTEQYDNDEFDEQDARYATMASLMESVAAETEIPVWEGVVMKSHPAHMVGIDPKVKRIEDWRQADWIYRDYLKPRMEVLKRYRKIDPERLMTAGVYDSNGMRMGNDARDNENVAQQQPEGSAISSGSARQADGDKRTLNDWDNLLVRVIECKRTQTVYVLVEGLDFYADQYQPKNRHEDWYEIEPFVFNRPPGNVRLAGLSDSELQAKEQDRLNRIDTDEDEDCRAARPHGLFDKDVVEDWDGRGFDSLKSHEWLGVSFGGKAMAEAFLPIPGQQLQPEIHATRRATAKSNLQSMSGLPEQLTGATGNPKFAEQVKVLDKGASTLMSLRASMANDFLRSTYRKFIHLITVNASVELMTALLGPNVVPIWSQKPEDRLQILRHLSVKVNPSVAGSPAKDDTLKGLALIQQIDAAPPGMVDKELLMKTVARVIELPLDVDQLVKPDANSLAMRLGQQVASAPNSLDPQVLMQLARLLMPLIQQDIQQLAAANAAGMPPGGGPAPGPGPGPGPGPAAPPAGALPPPGAGGGPGPAIHPPVGHPPMPPQAAPMPPHPPGGP